MCEQALLWALASADLSFALRVCQHVDDEGMVIDPDLRDALFRTVGFAIKELPGAAAVSVNFDVDDVVGATRPDGEGTAAPAAAAVAGDTEDEISGADGGGREWKVEGTNATMEELWALDALLQR